MPVVCFDRATNFTSFVKKKKAEKKEKKRRLGII